MGGRKGAHGFRSRTRWSACCRGPLQAAGRLSCSDGGVRCAACGRRGRQALPREPAARATEASCVAWGVEGPQVSASAALSMPGTDGVRLASQSACSRCGRAEGSPPGGSRRRPPGASESCSLARGLQDCTTYRAKRLMPGPGLPWWERKCGLI